MSIAFTIGVALVLAQRAFADGTIRTHGHCLDSDGISVFLGQCDAGKMSQVWGFYAVRNPAYGRGPEALEPESVDVLVNKYYGECLDVEAGELQRGANVIIWQCTGRKAQRWQRPDPASESGPLKLNYGLITRCLEIPGDDFQTGVRPLIQECHDRSSQRFIHLGLLGEFSIRAEADRDLCVSTGGNSAFLDDCQVSETPRNWIPPRAQRLDQYWEWVEDDGTLRNAKYPTACLQVRGTPLENEARVALDRCNGGAHQKWELPRLGSTGQITIGSYCLDIARGQRRAKAELLISKCRGDQHQKFIPETRVVCNVAGLASYCQGG